MNEKVKEFLETKKEAERKKYEEKKKKLLLEAGLYEKIHVDVCDDETFFEYDEASHTQVCYKMVPVNVTDEEYEEIKKYLSQSDDAIDALRNHFNKNNTIATILTVIAWVVYICGFISGFVLGVDSWGDPTILMLVYWIASFIVGTVYLGFAEIIKLLTEIKNK